MPVLTVVVPDDIFDELILYTKQRLINQVSKVAESSISKVEWLRSHPDGKRFLTECMSSKYAGLSQKELGELTDSRYKLAMGLRATNTKKLNEKDLRNEIIIEALREKLMPAKNDNIVKINRLKTK